MYITLSWDAYSDPLITTDCRYHIATDPNWYTWPVADGSTSVIIGPLIEGYLYEFQIRARSLTTGRVTDWTTSEFLVLGASPWALTGDAIIDTIDLDFENNRYYQDGGGESLTGILSISRASTAYADSVAGVWSSFSSGIARRTDKGLLVEESRTNSIQNNSAQGAVAGTPGTLPTHWAETHGSGLSRQIVGVGTENGVDYIDIRIFGTATSASQIFIWPESGTNVIAASSGQKWFGSYFLSIPAGSLTGITSHRMRLQSFDSGGSQIEQATNSLSLPSATQTRFASGITLANASSVYIRQICELVYSNGAAIDATIRLGWPQLELGSFATSPIRTTTAAATRAADVVTVTAPPTISSNLTLYADATPLSLSTSTVQVAFSVNDGTTNNRVAIYRSNTDPILAITAGGSSATLDGGSWAVSTRSKMAGAYTAGSQGVSIAGGAAVTGTSALAPSGLNQVSVGCSGVGDQQFNGYLHRLALWNGLRVSDSGLQALTSG